MLRKLGGNWVCGIVPGQPTDLVQELNVGTVHENINFHFSIPELEFVVVL